MSATIKNNTEELRNILEQIEAFANNNNSASSISYDMTLKFNTPQGSNVFELFDSDLTTNNLQLESGFASDVKNKMIQYLPTKIGIIVDTYCFDDHLIGFTDALGLYYDITNNLICGIFHMSGITYNFEIDITSNNVTYFGAKSGLYTTS